MRSDNREVCDVNLYSSHFPFVLRENMALNIRLGGNKFFVNNGLSRTFTTRPTLDKCLKNYQKFVSCDIPTSYFQSSLPLLPVPDLQQTCAGYLSAVRPLVDDGDYRRTEEIVDNFRLVEGAKLQRMLIELNGLNNRTSYMAKPWLDKYLSDRKALPINANPLLLMEMDSRHAFNDQLIKTCNIVISTLRLMKSIQNDSLQPTVDYSFRSEHRRLIVRSIIRCVPHFLATKTAHSLKAIPKDMVQFQSIFGRTRIPDIDRDSTVQYDGTNDIIVLKNGRIFWVKVLNEIGDIEWPEVIFNRINRIYQLNPSDDTNCSNIASLTTLERANWAELRRHLSMNLENKMQLQRIDSALFCVSIENSKSMKHLPQLNVLFAGDGKNRWFDKSLTVAIDADGTVGLSFEHSYGDGRMMQRINEEIHNDSTTSPFITPTTIYDATETTAEFDEFVGEIKFNVDATIKSEVKHAIENHTLNMHSLALNNFRFIKLNKKVCKKFHLSPDSIAQLGFQLALYKQHGKFVSTYEPCNTQKFLHARTEAIRPCTAATQQLCHAICRKTENNSKLYAFINSCSEWHTRLVQQSANGQGYDRHLYCLRYLAEENGLDEPQLYRDGSYKVLTRNTLVSTNVSSKSLQLIAFGPANRDGYGMWYEIDDNSINLTISYYPAYVDGVQFLALLEESYNEIFSVLDASKFN